MERTLFFIKPEARRHTETIISRIKKGGLSIVESKVVTITEEIFSDLYGHVPPEVQPRLRAQMLNQSCFLGILEGEDAVHRLAEIVGTHSHPPKCSSESLRYLLGDHRPGHEHLNGVHRPKTKEEVAAHLHLFGYSS